MSLEFTSVPPVPRGMNLSGPPLFIDDAYCRWMQDVLVDRPGQIRMRGPLTHWYTGGTPVGHQGLGAADTITPDGNWRGAVFNTGSSTTNGAYPSSFGEMNVFDKDATLVGTVTLPFKLNTVWSSANNHWVNNTIITYYPITIFYNKISYWYSIKCYIITFIKPNTFNSDILFIKNNICYNFWSYMGIYTVAYITYCIVCFRIS